VLAAALAASPGLRRWVRPPLERLGLLKTYQEGAYYLDVLERHRRENAALRTPCLILFGDSLTEAFPARLAAPRGWAVRGIAGDRVRHLAARLGASVEGAPCGSVALLAGTNDVVIDGAAPEDVAQQLALLASALRANGRAVLLATVPPVRGRHAGANADIRALDERIRELARTHDFVLVDLYGVLVDDSGQLDARYSRDDVHLGDAAYERWTELLADAAQNAK
jgi:lysophospholipase L1-like esterase